MNIWDDTSQTPAFIRGVSIATRPTTIATNTRNIHTSHAVGHTYSPGQGLGGHHTPTDTFFLSSTSATNLPKFKHHRRTHSASAAFTPRKPAPPTPAGTNVGPAGGPPPGGSGAPQAPSHGSTHKDHDHRDGSKSRLPRSSKHHRHEKGRILYSSNRLIFV